MKKQNILFGASVLFTVLAFLLSACTEAYKPHLIGVKTDPEKLNLMKGDKATLKAVALPSRLELEISPPTWELLVKNDEDEDTIVEELGFATVVQQGNDLEITAVKPGKAKIRVTIEGGYSAECEITVSDFYTVTFNSNGGSAVDPIRTEIGKKITEPEKEKWPAKPPYVFGGWFKDNDGTLNNDTASDRWNFGNDTVSRDITLYAKWLPAGTALYTVAFDSNGGSEVPNINNVASGEKINQPANPTKTGLRSVFGGWYKDLNSANADDLSIDKRWNFGTDTVTADTTLYAKWVLYNTPTYDIIFDSGVAMVTGLMEGAYIPKPTNPAKNGSIFESWHTAKPKSSGSNTSQTDNNKWDFDTDTVANDKFNQYVNVKDYASPTLLLYAKWTAVTYYTVTFNKNNSDTTGSTEADPKTKSGSSSGVGTLPTAPARSGYTFVEWNTKADGSGTAFTATTPVTANITVYAKWAQASSPPIAVTLNSVTQNGGAAGTATTTSLTLTFDKAITGLSANDINLSGVTGVTKGTLSGSGTTYTLNITVTASGTLSVSVSSPAGYNVSGSPKTTTVHYCPSWFSGATGMSISSSGPHKLEGAVDEDATNKIFTLGTGYSVIAIPIPSGLTGTETFTITYACVAYGGEAKIILKQNYKSGTNLVDLDSAFTGNKYPTLTTNAVGTLSLPIDAFNASYQDFVLFQLNDDQNADGKFIIKIISADKDP